MSKIISVFLNFLIKRIPWLLETLGKNFDKIPVLAKLKGYRSAIGLVLLALLSGVNAYHPIDPSIFQMIQGSLVVFTGLSLNASGR